MPDDTAHTHDRPPAFKTTAGTARPAKTTDIRMSEVNTQRYAAGSRNGPTGGQGPALDSK